MSSFEDAAARRHHPDWMIQGPCALAPRALYVKDGRLKYVYNFIGELEQIVESNETIPSGHVVLSA